MWHYASAWENKLLEFCHKVLEKSSNKSLWNLYWPWEPKLLFLQTDWALWPNVVYGFQVLKKFGDVVWHVSWSVTGNILVVSGGDNKVRYVYFEMMSCWLRQHFELTSFNVMHAVLLVNCHITQFCPNVKQSNSRCWWGGVNVFLLP